MKWPSGNYEDLNSSIIEKFAKAKGLIVVPGRPTHLLLDIDGGEENYNDVRKRLINWFDRGDFVKAFRTFKSLGGVNHHVHVLLTEPLEHIARIGVQAILGSDRVREELSLKRLASGDPMPSLLVTSQELLDSPVETFGDFDQEVV